MVAKGTSGDPANRLGKAIAALPALEREVLLLSAADGLTGAQIAERLGVEPREVSRLLAEALARLDRAMERLSRPWWRIL